MESTAQSSNSDAVNEGRRIYLGNLLYRIKPYEIEDALAANDFGDFAQIHISVDPVSGRNPGYCFVDFNDRATAERALTELQVTLAGRALKVGPCEPKKQRGRGGAGGGGGGGGDRDDSQPSFQRWGDWRTAPGGDSRGSGGRSRDAGAERQGPRAALESFDNTIDDGGRRLYVGGLGKMVDQAQNQEEIREIFAGFNPKSIGKRITASEQAAARPGNHNYCFIIFETAEEATAARDALDGTMHDGGPLKVRIARRSPTEFRENRPDPSRYGGGRNANEGSSWRQDGGSGGGGSAERPQRDQRALASNNWRRKDDGAA